MKFLRKLIRKTGRGIKKAFRFVGNAFKKVFGVFGKLGPIGSIALMFVLPGLGQMFSQGLGWLQSAVGTTGELAAKTAIQTAAEAGATEAAKAAAGTAAKEAAKAGLLGSKNAALRGVGRIGQALIGDANTAARISMGKFSLESGLVGNMGTATNKLTGWLKDGLMKVPGAEPFENWLNKQRGKWGFETNQDWLTKQKGLIDKGVVADQAYQKALNDAMQLGQSLPYEEWRSGWMKSNPKMKLAMDAGASAQSNLNRSIIKQGSYPSIGETEKAFTEGYQVKEGQVVLSKEGTPVTIDPDTDKWNPKEIAATSLISGAITAGFSSLMTPEQMGGGQVSPMPANEQAKDYYVQNMMNTYKTGGYEGKSNFNDMLNSPWIYGSGTADWLQNYGQGITIPAPQPIQLGNA